MWCSCRPSGGCEQTPRGTRRNVAARPPLPGESHAGATWTQSLDFAIANAFTPKKMIPMARIPFGKRLGIEGGAYASLECQTPWRAEDYCLGMPCGLIRHCRTRRHMGRPLPDSRRAGLRPLPDSRRAGPFQCSSQIPTRFRGSASPQTKSARKKIGEAIRFDGRAEESCSTKGGINTN